MNKTLDIVPNALGPINFREVFDKLTNKGYWVGTASGMNPWMQLDICYDSNIKVYFSIFKHEIVSFVNSVKVFYKIKNIEIHYIGDSEEDKWFAYYQHCIFHKPKEFMEYLKRCGI